jgi:hypothetical protein
MRRGSFALFDGESAIFLTTAAFQQSLAVVLTIHYNGSQRRGFGRVAFVARLAEPALASG